MQPISRMLQPFSDRALANTYCLLDNVVDTVEKRHAILVVDSTTGTIPWKLLGHSDPGLTAWWPLGPWTFVVPGHGLPSAQCLVPSVQCPVSGSNLHVTDSAGMPSYHHNHQLALQLRVNKCECRLQEIFYFWQKYSTFGRNILLLAEIFYFWQKYSTFATTVDHHQHHHLAVQLREGLGRPRTKFLTLLLYTGQCTGHTLNTHKTRRTSNHALNC